MPVFDAKHISSVWADAKWMDDQAVRMKVPFMAGSLLPVPYRSHARVVPMGSEIEYAVGFRGSRFMLPSPRLTVVGVKRKGKKPVAAGFEERPEPRYPHFAWID